MAFASLIQVIKVNEPRSGVKDGRAWTMQDAECILLGADGEPEAVGVLMIPKALTGMVTKGYFSATFALGAGMRDRRIEAILTGLSPVDLSAIKRQARPAAAAPAAPAAA